MEIVQDVITWITAIVTAASFVVKAVEVVADITPTDKDDKYVSKGKKWIAKAMAILDKIAINPRRDG